ncbi:DUF3772 domain-containing protein [Paracoccus siganidrum]|uniref:Mechanosensitive ion channel family protein n=1 Tax=Paracoccus siganidrum TaxID=1276757 RepID=A0A418ZYC1_9RHOB|nr:DUF3772 domain-containing protein [Paracoccus siganidrum]RJL05492.1 mechanosensitive ion channel family protein [Paracoccus siganidrum]RMC29960.1 DUF3772 domain-containing protein [Paracoccus siganidrum]
MARAFLAVILMVLTLLAAPLAAQEISAPDYDVWERVASRAEALIDNRDASDEDLNRTRAEIADWRRQFQDAQGINANRIKAVQDQIAALGDPPGEGQSEDPEIATRRADLNEQLSTLQAPRLAAIEAHSRADSITNQIAGIIADRQATTLARQSPSPLLPGNWVEAGAQGAALSEAISTEFSQRFAERGTWEQLQPRLPHVLAYLVAALVMLTAGRAWVRSLPSRMSARASDHSRAVVAFVVSLGQIAIPVIGVYLAVSALKATHLFGEWTTPFLDALPRAGLILFGGIWLARVMFPRRAIAYQTLTMPEDARNTARRMVDLLAVAFALRHILSYAMMPLTGVYWRAGDPDTRVPMEFGEGAISVWHFVLIAVAGFALFRLGNVLRRMRQWAEPDDPSFRYRVLSVLGYVTRPIVVLALLLSLLGFINLANLLVWPWSLSLMLALLLVALQDFIADVFNMVKRGEEGAREGLAPLLIGFGLILMSVPVFMVIWGARQADLIDRWSSFQQGVSLGGVRLSPGSVLTFLIIFAIGYVVTRAVQGAFRGSILPKTRLDPGGQNAVVAGLGYVGIVIAALLAITSAGIDLSSIAFVAGALSVGIGFGLQNIVSNFVSGIILLIERPISVGDWISTGNGDLGVVKRISVRSTQVETFDRTEVIVPNSDLISQPVTNWTRHNKMGRIILPVGVAPTSDTRKVASILMEIIEDQPIVTIDPAPSVLFRGITVDAMNFEIRAVLSDVAEGMGVTSEVYHRIVERFAEEGIGLPFTARDVWPRPPGAEDAPEGEDTAAAATQAMIVAPDEGEEEAGR